MTNPQTVSAFSQTTRTYHSYLQDNVYVWRSLYLNYFDDPREYDVDTVDWKQDVQQRTRAYFTTTSSNPSFEDVEIDSETLLDIVHTAHPGTSPSRTTSWLKKCVTPTFIWQNAAEPLSETRAQLQVLECKGDHRDASKRLVSRSYVYDMRNYTQKSLYGPFCPRRRASDELKVNFIHLRHLMNVQLNNLDDGLGDSTFDPPRGFDSTRAMSAPPSLVEGDWAGVEGEWARLGCWMEYDLLEGPSTTSLILHTTYILAEYNVRIADHPPLPRLTY